jgi:hypothetical protein
MIAIIGGTAMAGGTIVIITRLRRSTNSNALARKAKGEPGGSPFAIL